MTSVVAVNSATRIALQKTTSYSINLSHAIRNRVFVVVASTVSLSDISVDSVHPLYGPIAGGTRVTVAGQYLSVTSVITVYFGQYQRIPIDNGLVLSFIY